ncbi:lysozyme inhibitor LprI family protein [Wenxinia marina]|uniref:Lysozyme inhibitor LprI-like N-terminal domain-containing protein n=1 Tax=Wenxinia marina DSM 24838 TaxID=1123501 RepID=A0A0D0Q9Z4_9RHOB|nr:lysozyme inhibitor LprI family protein [Wenxinia marina]KIQ71244.1 hypothetical protein Wenmar_00010 [Wenxinia marina DSM 24838]GGL73101.1 hypothetical protein GCM10011392_29680 [Wenxinia marina]
MRPFAIFAPLLAAAPLPALAQDVHDAYASGVAACFEEAPSVEAARACEGAAAAACMDGAEDGQTTFGMVQCQLAERDAWDALLNREYQDAIETFAADDAAEASADFARREESLRAAQRAWIAWRDAECALMQALWGGGTMGQVDAAGCLLRLTAERTVDLRALRESQP